MTAVVGQMVAFALVLAQSSADSEINTSYYLVGAVIGAGIGAAIGSTKNRVLLGAILGFFLGCIGWIIVGVLPKKRLY